MSYRIESNDSAEVRFDVCRFLVHRSGNCDTSFRALLSSVERLKMTVDLDNPALGLASEVKPHEQLALQVGLINLTAGVGFEPTDRGTSTVAGFTARSIRPLCQPAKGSPKASGSGLATWLRWPFIFISLYTV
jgi:hypothetical protein